MPESLSELELQTVTLTSAVYKPTRFGHEKWEAWGDVDGMRVRVTIYPEDVRWFKDVMGIEFVAAGMSAIQPAPTVMLRHEKTNGLRVDGAQVNGRYRRIEAYRQALQAGDDAGKLAALSKDARLEAALMGRIQPWELLQGIADTASDDAVLSTKRVKRIS